MNTTPSPIVSMSRTRLITFVSIIAVGFAGAIAVGANLGILNKADSSNVGTISVPDLVAPAPQVVDVTIGGAPVDGASPQATLTESAAPNGAQEFVVDTAGTVSVVRTADGIRMESTNPAPGWTWQLHQTQPTELTVTLRNGARTLEFAAAVGSDGTVQAGVNEIQAAPAPTVNQTPAADPVPSASHDDGDHEGGEHDD